jgi:hypothetical protein
MKRLIVLAAVAAVICGYSSARAEATTRPVSATLTGTATLESFWCCGFRVRLDGRGVVRGIGAVTFSGSYMSGSIPTSPPYGGEAHLDLTLTAPNGDAIVIAGSIVFPLGEGRLGDPLPWSIASSTGRFAQASGSGTYTVRLTRPLSPTTSCVTITLVGSLDV